MLDASSDTAPDPQHPVPRTDELYRLLIENVQDYAIFMLSPDGRVVSWNEGAQRIYGFCDDQIVGRHIAVFYPEPDRQRGDPDRELRVARSQGRCQSEAWRLRSDGTQIWTSVVLTALRDEGERLIGFGKIVRDLTDRKQIARQYEESRQRYRSLFEYNPDAVFAFDFDGGLHSVNPAAAALSGYEVAELLELSFLSMLPRTERARAQECFQRAAAGEPQWLETALIRRDRRRVELHVAVVPILVHGEILGVYALAEDVTARKHAEAERERLLLRETEARAEAEQANRAKSDFLAVMSHELRTPLNAISGYTELVYDGDAGPLTALQRRHLDRVRTSAARLLALIEEILDYARMDTDKEVVHFGPTDLVHLLHELVAWMGPKAEERKLLLRLDLIPPVAAAVTDAGTVRRVLLLLMSNALKFTPSGEVRLFLEQEEQEVRIGVTDTGIGISPEHHEQIFEPFWQVGSVNTRAAEGAGLGLSLARRLARRLGGEIVVQSAPERGSTFVLRLPVSPPDI